MRWLLAAGLVCCASLTAAQEEKPPEKKMDPPPVIVTNYDFPRDVKIGEEFTFTAKLKNNVGRLAIVSLRLQLDESIQVLPPNEEQTVFVETGAPRTVAWRAKRVGEGNLNGNVDSYLIALKHGPEQSIPKDDLAALHKVWDGKFTDPTSEYSARLEMKVHPDGAVEGKIRWKLLKHVDDEQKKFVGKGGIEYVWGVYNPKTRFLQVEGYRRDDPQQAIGLDRYRLTLAPEGIRLKGTTWNHGSDDGKLSLTPVEEE